MTEPLRTLLTLSLSGGVLALLLLALAPLVRGRVSRQWQYYIWLIVVARLLLPLPSPWRPPAGDAPGALPGSAAQRATALSGGVSGAVPETPGASAGAAAEAPIDRRAAAEGALAAGWLAGTLACAARRGTAYRRFAREVRTSGTPVTDPAVLGRFAAAAREAGVRRQVELWENARIASPLLMGFVRPRIVLPDAALPPERLRMALLHEMCHLRRHDLIFKLVVQAAVCIHWFNPIVRRMEREAGRLCELSCDEAVLRRLDAGERRSYGDALIGALHAGEGVPGTAALSADARLLKERLEDIMKFSNRASKVRIAAAAALTAVLCTAAAAAGVPAQGEAAAASVPDLPDGATTELMGFYWTDELVIDASAVGKLTVCRGEGRSLRFVVGSQLIGHYKVSSEDGVRFTDDLNGALPPGARKGGCDVAVLIPDRYLESVKIHVGAGELEVSDLSAHRMELTGAPRRVSLQRIDAGTLGMEFTGSDVDAGGVTVRQAFGATASGGSMRIAGDLRCDVTLATRGAAAIECAIENGNPDDYSIYGGVLLSDGRIGEPVSKGEGLYYQSRENAPYILHIDSDGDPARSVQVFLQGEPDADA